MSKSNSGYQPGIVSEVLSWPEVASTFRNIAQFGLEYRGGTLTIGEFDPETGIVKSHCSYEAMGEMTKQQAISALRKERDSAFKPEFRSKVALVVNGEVIEKGEPHQKKRQPFEYHLTQYRPFSNVKRRGEWYGHDVGVVDLVVLGTDIMTVTGYDTSLTSKIRAADVGQIMEQKLGIKNKTAEVGSRDLYVSGRYSLHADIGFDGDSVEFVDENIDVLVRREANKNLVIATLNPHLKDRVTSKFADEIGRLAWEQHRPFR